MLRVLFVCTGNTCRSPMAEGLFRRIAREEGLVAEVKSAGIAALEGAPFADNAMTVLKERQAIFEGTSSSISPELLTWADVIFVMTAGHKQALLSQSPENEHKIHLLKEYVEHNQQAKDPTSSSDKPSNGGTRVNYDIADPVGGTLEDYRHCADELEGLLRQWVTSLKS